MALEMMTHKFLRQDRDDWPRDIFFSICRVRPFYGMDTLTTDDEAVTCNNCKRKLGLKIIKRPPPDPHRGAGRGISGGLGDRSARKTALESGHEPC